ncbi:MAG: hypothetical protein RI947_968 [Candidatus Parcubacteria bacterium]
MHMKTLHENIANVSPAPQDTEINDETYSTLLKQALKLTNAKKGSLLLTRQGKLQRVYSSISSPDLNRVSTILATFPNNSIVGPIVLEERYLKDYLPEIYNNQVRTLVVVPMKNGDLVIGYLILTFNNNVVFSRDELKSFKLFGLMACLAVKKSEMYAEIKRTLEIRDIFIALASHELKTPLTTITGYIQLLHRRMGMKESDSLEHKWINQLAKESQRFSVIIEELLTVNKIRSGSIAYSFALVNLVELIHTVIDTQRIRYADTNITFETDITSLALVKADRLHLMQATGKVIENALKFSGKNDPVTIRLESEKNLLNLYVIDRGNGIHEQDLDHIFDGFYKPKDNHRSGLALGLMSARYIVEKHGGTLTVYRSSPKGTVMKISLPEAV